MNNPNPVGSSNSKRVNNQRKTHRMSVDFPGSCRNSSMRSTFQENLFQQSTSQEYVVKNKGRKFERFGNLKPREELNQSRNYVVVTKTNSNSPTSGGGILNDSIFNQSGGLSYNPADTGLYLQSLTQIPRNQTFSA